MLLDLVRLAPVWKQLSALCSCLLVGIAVIVAPAAVSLFILGFQAVTELSLAGCRALGGVSGHRAELARLHGAIILSRPQIIKEV